MTDENYTRHISIVVPSHETGDKSKKGYRFRVFQGPLYGGAEKVKSKLYDTKKEAEQEGGEICKLLSEGQERQWEQAYTQVTHRYNEGELMNYALRILVKLGKLSLSEYEAMQAAHIKENHQKVANTTDDIMAKVNEDERLANAWGEELEAHKQLLVHRGWVVE